MGDYSVVPRFVASLLANQNTESHHADIRSSQLWIRGQICQRCKSIDIAILISITRNEFVSDVNFFEITFILFQVRKHTLMGMSGKSNGIISFTSIGRHSPTKILFFL